jgi:hypothetical protein
MPISKNILEVLIPIMKEIGFSYVSKHHFFEKKHDKILFRFHVLFRNRARYVNLHYGFYIKEVELYHSKLLGNENETSYMDTFLATSHKFHPNIDTSRYVDDEKSIVHNFIVPFFKEIVEPFFIRFSSFEAIINEVYNNKHRLITLGFFSDQRQSAICYLILLRLINHPTYEDSKKYLWITFGAMKGAREEYEELVKKIEILIPNNV